MTKTIGYGVLAVVRLTISVGGLQALAAGEDLGNAKTACMVAVNDNYGGKVKDLRVTSSELSQANSIVTMDADGERWRCLVSNDGKVEDLSVVEGR